MNVRIPSQKRSIEKRNKIIEMGFNLICEKGYYNVTTNDIAEYANVSIGIIYQYFKDKKDIFICGVENYSNSIMFPVLDILKGEKITKDNINFIIEKIIDNFIKQHTMSKKAHEELLAMSHTDDDIGKIFSKNETDLAKKIIKTLKENDIKPKNILEKFHISYALIDNLCHEIVYHHDNNIDYDIMKKETISIISSLLLN